MLEGQMLEVESWGRAGASREQPGRSCVSAPGEHCWSPTELPDS